MAKKILLADDSITIQKVVSLTLSNEDYELIIASDGKTALEKARQTKPDLVIADLSMPAMNGYELCEAIKSEPELSNTPVLLLASTFEPIDEERARTVGADDHILKPFESEQLLDKIEQLLSPSTGEPMQPQPADSGKDVLTEELWEPEDFESHNDHPEEAEESELLELELVEEPVEEAQEPVEELASALSEEEGQAEKEPPQQESPPEGSALQGLPRERVEQIVREEARKAIEEVLWDVVPELAEECIRKELIDRLSEAFSKHKR